MNVGRHCLTNVRDCLATAKHNLKFEALDP